MSPHTNAAHRAWSAMKRAIGQPSATRVRSGGSDDATLATRVSSPGPPVTSATPRGSCSRKCRASAAKRSGAQRRVGQRAPGWKPTRTASGATLMARNPASASARAASDTCSLGVVARRRPPQRLDRGQVEADRRQRARSHVMRVHRRAPALERVADAHACAARARPDRGARVAEEIQRHVGREPAHPSTHGPCRGGRAARWHDDQLVDARVALEEGRARRLGDVGHARLRARRAGRVQRRQGEAHVAEEARADEQEPLHRARVYRTGRAHGSWV